MRYILINILYGVTEMFYYIKGLFTPIAKYKTCAFCGVTSQDVRDRKKEPNVGIGYIPACNDCYKKHS